MKKRTIEIKVSGPLGPSERGKGFGTAWNNIDAGVDGPVTCEICGTHCEERRDQSYIISVFLGHRVVEECCGAIFDLVYRESGEEFMEAYLEDFAKDPTNVRFYFLPETIENILSKTRKKILETREKVGKALNIAKKLPKQSKKKQSK